MKNFSCNSESYTKEHNDIMNELLWSLANCNNHCIDFDTDHDYYIAINEKGLKILEHLRDLDLIEEIFDEQE